jgi:EAL domain-containing protein (putative c-di-GMP-specific phosphodiesterase class I)
VSLTGRRLVGLESLIRWRRPGFGLVPPDQFIPAAEESGYIRSIGEWVIREACAQLARWSAEGFTLVPVAINVSSRQCADMAIVDTIRDALAHSRLDPQLLKIELTESTAMHKPDFVAELLLRVAELGVGISVDDFGTGYSSLSYLKRFPVSELKIDRSFVAGITHAGDDAAIVQGTIALAHGLGKTVVAEGVETDEQLASSPSSAATPRRATCSPAAAGGGSAGVAGGRKARPASVARDVAGGGPIQVGSAHRGLAPD